MNRIAFVISLAVVAVGCAPSYPDTNAGRACRWSREVCGGTALYPTVDSCLEQYASSESGRTAECLTARHDFEACQQASGSAGCGIQTPPGCESAYATLEARCFGFLSPSLPEGI